MFLLTNLAFQVLVGQATAYAICKPAIAQTFGYDEAFLGKLDVDVGKLEAVAIMG